MPNNITTTKAIEPMGNVDGTVETRLHNTNDQGQQAPGRQIICGRGRQRDATQSRLIQTAIGQDAG